MLKKIQELNPIEIYRQVKRLIIFVIGISILLVGITFIVLPGPAIVVIPLGLAILATEFVWAAKTLKKLKAETKKVIKRF